MEMDAEMERERNEDNGRVEVDQVVDNAVGEQQNGNGEGEVGKMAEDFPVTKDNGSSSRGGEKQHVSTSAATTEKLQLDLNEMPPPEHDWINVVVFLLRSYLILVFQPYLISEWTCNFSFS